MLRHPVGRRGHAQQPHGAVQLREPPVPHLSTFCSNCLLHALCWLPCWLQQSAVSARHFRLILSCTKYKILCLAVIWVGGRIMALPLCCAGRRQICNSSFWQQQQQHAARPASQRKEGQREKTVGRGRAPPEGGRQHMHDCNTPAGTHENLGRRDRRAFPGSCEQQQTALSVCV